MTDPICIFVPGTPAPGGSKKAFRHFHTGRIVVKDDCKRNASWRQVVAIFAHQAMKGREPLDGPLQIAVDFRVPRPRGHVGARGLKPSAPGHPTVKPDVTKLLRALEDACTGIVWIDDAQIVLQTVSKAYSDPSHPSGATLKVWPLH